MPSRPDLKEASAKTPGGEIEMKGPNRLSYVIVYTASTFVISWDLNCRGGKVSYQ